MAANSILLGNTRPAGDTLLVESRASRPRKTPSAHKTRYTLRTPVAWNRRKGDLWQPNRQPRLLNEQDLRDLGFGAVVSRESQQRLLNRDGSFNVERTGLRFWSSFSAYHAMLTIPWWQFFSATAVLVSDRECRVRGCVSGLRTGCAGQRHGGHGAPHLPACVLLSACRRFRRSVMGRWSRSGLPPMRW